MHETLLNEGLTLMLAGMGTVFVFLTMLVIAMSLMSALLKGSQGSNTDIPEEEVAAISAAIQKHRSNQ